MSHGFTFWMSDLERGIDTSPKSKSCEIEVRCLENCLFYQLLLGYVHTIPNSFPCQHEKLSDKHVHDCSMNTYPICG